MRLLRVLTDRAQEANRKVRGIAFPRTRRVVLVGAAKAPIELADVPGPIVVVVKQREAPAMSRGNDTPRCGGDQPEEVGGAIKIV